MGLGDTRSQEEEGEDGTAKQLFDGIPVPLNSKELFSMEVDF